MRTALCCLTLAAVLMAACGRDDENPVVAAPNTTSANTATRAPATDAERAELAFLEGMVRHHAQAVEMASLCPERAQHEEMKQLCRDIITAQTGEIARMKEWASSWYGAMLSEQTGEAHGGGGHEGGIQSDEDLKALGGLSGNAFDLRFIDLMTAHHKGAIDSARKIRPTAVHREVTTLADDIVRAQEEEISRMAAWKAAWS